MFIKSNIEFENITRDQFISFWNNLTNEDLDSLGTHNMLDILDSAVYIKGIWNNSSLAAIGGLCGVFRNKVITTFHIVHKDYRGRGYTHDINHAYTSYAKHNGRAIIINSIDLHNKFMEQSILKDGFRQFYQNNKQRWYYLVLNKRGELLAKLLPIVVRIYFSAPAFPLRLLRSLIKRYRNILLQYNFRQSIVMVLVYLLCKPLTPLEYLRFIIANIRQLRIRIKILRQFRHIHKHIECLHSEGELLRIADNMLSKQMLSGNIVECGTYGGGATCKLSILARLTGRKVIAYDSFEGLPMPINEETKFFAKGDYMTPLELFEHNLAHYGEPDYVQAEVGWFNKTITETCPEQIVLIFEDADIYESVSVCIDKLWGNLNQGCRMYTHEMLFPFTLNAYKERGLMVNKVGYGLRITTHNLGYVEK